MRKIIDNKRTKPGFPKLKFRKMTQKMKEFINNDFKIFWLTSSSLGHLKDCYPDQEITRVYDQTMQRLFGERRKKFYLCTLFQIGK